MPRRVKTNRPTTYQNAYGNSGTDIGVVLGLSAAILQLLRVMLRLAAHFDEQKQAIITETIAKAKENVNEEDEKFHRWDWVMVFKVLDEEDSEPKKHSMQYIIKQLKKGGLDTVCFFSIQYDLIFVKIRIPKDRLKAEADRINYKLLFEEESLRGYCERNHKKWKAIEIEDVHKQCVYTPYQYIYGKFENAEEDDPDGITHLYVQYEDSNSGEKSVFKGTDRLKIIRGIISARENDGGCFLDVEMMIKQRDVLDFFPLHDYAELLTLEKRWLNMWAWPSSLPVDHIKNYYGEKIALYYVWLEHYSTWLMPAAFIGILCWIPIGTNYNDPNQSSIAVFAVFISVWVTGFLEFWKRKEANRKMLWGTTGYEEEEQVRPQFEGEPITSPIDGSDELYFDPQTSAKRQIISTFVTSMFIFMVVGILVGIQYSKILFAQQRYKQMFTINVLGNDIALGPQIPGILNAVQVPIMDAIYNDIAYKLNVYENHRTDTAFEDALIAKLFVFSSVNAFLVQLYTAFQNLYPDSMSSKGACLKNSCLFDLRLTLSTNFISKLAIKNILAVLFPYLDSMNETEDAEVGFDPERKMSPAEQQYQYIKFDVSRGPIGFYQDRINMFGYSTLFVTAYPLALPLSFVNNYIEIRIGGWHLCQHCRRPEPKGAEDIGTWYACLEFLGYAAAMLNSAIICFSSNILGHNLTMFRKVVNFIIFEHLLLAFKVGLALVVEDSTDDTEIQLKRVEFIGSKVIENVADDADDIEERNDKITLNLIINEYDKSKQS